MTEKNFEFKLCPDCGSTEYMENYPTPGTSICDDCGHEITSIALKELNEKSRESFSPSVNVQAVEYKTSREASV